MFGQKAVREGLRWGWFHEYVELTSPWSLRDFITQRRRWLWGDIHGVMHREVFSLPGAAVVVAKYLVGLVTVVFSLTGLYMKLTGQLPAASPVYDVFEIGDPIAGWRSSSRAGGLAPARGSPRETTIPGFSTP